MELKLNISNLQQLHKLGITPTQLVYLWSTVDDEVLIKTTPLDITNLEAKGFISSDGNISLDGHALLEDFFPEEVLQENILDYGKEFKELFDMYPFSDKYGNYPRTRTLRSNSKVAFTAFVEARKMHSFDIIKKGLINEIAFRQDATNNGTTNSFKFMKSLNNWLTSEEFTTYINLEKEDFRKLYGKDIE